MSLTSFVQSVLPYAQQTSAQTGLPLDYVLAQSAEETGAGSSNAALNLNNYFGISPGGSLASYPNVGAGFSAYSNLINARYSGASGFSNPSDIASYMVGRGYNTTDPGYAGKVAGLVPSVDAVLATLGVSGGSSGIPSASVSGQPAASSGGLWSSITDAVSRVGIILLAIVVIGVGLWMLAKGSPAEARA
jgi:hypothetical protein